jgi:hypothetical protein
VTDTIKRLPAGAPDAVRRRVRTIDRTRLWAMETPQAFDRSLITEAYQTVHRRRLTMTDDASAIELATRHGVTLVENPHPNPKLTTPADIIWAEFLLQQRTATRSQGSTEAVLECGGSTPPCSPRLGAVTSSIAASQGSPNKAAPRRRTPDFNSASPPL